MIYCEYCQCEFKRQRSRHEKTKKHQLNLFKEHALMLDDLKVLLVNSMSSNVYQYDTKENCCVCMEEDKKCFKGKFNCEHSYCISCLESINNNCPLCRAELVSA